MSNATLLEINVATQLCHDELIFLHFDLKKPVLKNHNLNMVVNCQINIL